MISYIHIIEALPLLSGALNSGGVVPPNNHCDIENFLRANGCENLVPGFIAEEIEVRQIAQLSDQDLVSLGVQTIGARLRLRSAAASWEPPQVYLFSFLDRHFVIAFEHLPTCVAFLHPGQKKAVLIKRQSLSEAWSSV